MFLLFIFFSYFKNKKMNNEKFTIFSCEGGIGKNILATTVVSSLKKSDPERKIIVVSAWVDVWFNNPNVYRVYPFGNLAHFYKTYIKDKDVKIYKHEPYFQEDYILKKKHLIETWCDLCNVEYDGSMPQIYLNPLEIEVAKLQISFEKPIMIIHANGGGGNQKIPYSWYRDLPYQNGVDVVEYFKNDYNIYQVGRENQTLLPNVKRLNAPLREIFCYFLFSKKRLLIDSFSQHLCAAFNLSSTVVWIGNKPEILGYKVHDNIVCTVPEKYDTLHSSYIEKADIQGNEIQYPYDTLKLFNSEDIIKSLLK
jgi:hypothetical protein